MKSAVISLSMALLMAGCGAAEPGKPRVLQIEVDDGQAIQSTSFEYSKSGRVLSIEKTESDDADDYELTFFEYDDDGEVNFYAFEGNDAEDAYECYLDREDDRVVSEECSGARDLLRDYSYDEEGRLQLVEEGQDALELDYDEDGVLERVRSRGSSPFDQEHDRGEDGLTRITRRYESLTTTTRIDYEDGRVSRISRDNETWKISYDSDDRISEIEVVREGEGPSTFVSFTYASGDVEGGLLPTLPNYWGRFISLDGTSYKTYPLFSGDDFYDD